MDNFIKFFKFLCDLKRKIKFVVQIFFDCFIFFISYFFALFLDKQYNLTYDKEFYIIFVIVLLSTILVLLFSGFYKNIIRHASPKILFLCVVASISSIILVYVLFYFTKIPISASFLLLFFFESHF